MEGPGWVETLKQGQEGDRWHLGESVTELWPHSPGWGGLLSLHWGLQNGTTTLLPPLLFQPLKREQRKESVCLWHRELARLKGSLVSSLSVRSCRKNAPRPSVGIRNTGMEGANAVTRSVSQVSDLGVLPSERLSWTPPPRMAPRITLLSMAKVAFLISSSSSLRIPHLGDSTTTPSSFSQARDDSFRGEVTFSLFSFFSYSPKFTLSCLFVLDRKSVV